MGRKAKIRSSRKQSLLSETTSNMQSPSQLSAKVPHISKESSPTQQGENLSFWGKIASFLNPFPKVDKYQGTINAHEFFEANQGLLVSTAQSGYQQKGKGFVLIQDLDTSPQKIEYISRKLLKKTMLKHNVDPEEVRSVDNMLEEYDPLMNVVMLYTSSNGDISLSMLPLTQPASE